MFLSDGSNHLRYYTVKKNSLVRALTVCGGGILHAALGCLALKCILSHNMRVLFQYSFVVGGFYSFTCTFKAAVCTAEAFC